eukprot:Gregarina_sp_Pseudo_9__3063@NODE_325_length_3153_cov_58_967566_g305_i0_p1_GENE_NODE_325_length_3153_cov_58_967566_g305_i0NODE_325_length_3153_cov_58_967566_g305_i0_p1_ORF_typecomplete_len416_score47_98RabGAPTBC/PF00566_18/1e50_NODE_325_length_3153_cov_58_967566_g305_i05051752
MDSRRRALLGDLSDSQRAPGDAAGTRDVLLGSALHTPPPDSTHVWRRWHRRDRSLFFTRSHSDFDSQRLPTSSLERYDPMGFQWPLSRRERTALQALYLAEEQQVAAGTAGWIKLIQSDGEFRDRPKAKKLARYGIPHQFRPYVWTMALGSQQLVVRNKNVYQSFLARHLNDHVMQQIMLDVPRTFPTHRMFQSQQENSSLLRLLYAFAVYNPVVNYCQSLNFIAAFLKMILPEEIAFWSMVQIIDTRLPDKGNQISGYYSLNMFELRRDLRVLEVLLSRRLPKVYRVFQSLDIHIEWLCSEWFLCLFITVFPMPLVLRIWDTLVFEGTKVLFRVALSVFKVLEPEIHRVRAFDEVIELVRNTFSSAHTMTTSPHTLLKVAFHRIGTLKRAEIDAIRAEQKELMTQEELRAAQRR